MPLRTVRGTLAELAEIEPPEGWLRVYVREQPRAGLREEVQELLPRALEVRIDPEMVPAPGSGTRPPSGPGGRRGELFGDYLDSRGHADEGVRELFDELLRGGGALMRPMRLDMAGFTVFRDETTVDFTDADFFALVGPTGSGKSTVLDAICFALYGTVPRWGGTRGLANALAPSATEARVRLVFESAGDRYVATRVVRRDGRGTVKTANAGLELMPPGFDVTKLDTGLSPEDLGEVVAGTPAEMEQAVLDAVGLPYEQFTSCVVLPQGQFADFLHAKPATRQQILVNLLGLGVYEYVQKKAVERAGQAEAKLETVDKMLGGLADVDDESLAAARERVDAMRELAAAVAAAVPEWEQARATAGERAAALAALDAELGVLAGVRPPDGTAELARAVAQARVAADEAAGAVGLAEEREEKLRGELAAAGDESALRLHLKAYADRDRLTAEAATVRAAVDAARDRARRRGGGAGGGAARTRSGPRRSWRRRSARTRRRRPPTRRWRCGRTWSTARPARCASRRSPPCRRCRRARR